MQVLHLVGSGSNANFIFEVSVLLLGLPTQGQPGLCGMVRAIVQFSGFAMLLWEILHMGSLRVRLGFHTYIQRIAFASLFQFVIASLLS